MTFIAAIIVGAAAVGGAVISSNASSKAAKTQAASTDKASAGELEMFYQNREDLAPWRETGKNALTTLYNKVEAGPGEFTESPGYEFRLGEGEKAINRAGAARGQFDSGKTYKALTKFNQDYATNDYDNFLNRWYQSLNPYASLAQVGQVATTDTANMGTQVASQVGQNTVSSGNARASGYLGSANAINEGIDSGVSNWLKLQYLNKQNGGSNQNMETIW
jgi:hypothetical protein